MIEVLHRPAPSVSGPFISVAKRRSIASALSLLREWPGPALGHGDVVRLVGRRADNAFVWDGDYSTFVEVPKPSGRPEERWEGPDADHAGDAGGICSWVEAWEGEGADASDMLRLCSLVSPKRVVMAACACARASIRGAGGASAGTAAAVDAAVDAAESWAASRATASDATGAAEEAYGAADDADAKGDVVASACAIAAACAAACAAAYGGRGSARQDFDRAAALAAAAARASAFVSASLRGEVFRRGRHIAATLDGAESRTGADRRRLAPAVRSCIPLSSLLCALAGVRDPGTPRSGERSVMRSHGRLSGAVIKLLGGGPARAAEFKRLHPVEFERIKPLLGGRHLTAATIADVVRRAEGPEWVVVRSKYTAKGQRLSRKANDLILLCVDPAGLGMSDRDRSALRLLSLTARGSKHPHGGGDLFVVGWVRYADEGGFWLIEEVQSDVAAAVRGLADADTRAKLEAGGVNVPSLEAALARLRPWTERVYEDAVGLVFALAKARGAEVEMLTYESKSAAGPPRSVYEDLPRRMGMVRLESGTVAPGAPAWHYRPNPDVRARHGR